MCSKCQPPAAAKSKGQFPIFASEFVGVFVVSESYISASDWSVVVAREPALNCRAMPVIIGAPYLPSAKGGILK